MSTIINFSSKQYPTIKEFRFNHKTLTIVDENDVRNDFIFIVLENKSKRTMIVTGYSKYLVTGLNNKSKATLEFHSKIIVSFLNYVFIDNFTKYKILDISEITINHGNNYLSDYAKGTWGNKSKTKKTVMKVEAVLNNFYLFLFNEGIKIDGIREYTQKKQLFNKNKHHSLFLISYPQHTPSKRIKYLSNELLGKILSLCDVYYPELKLAICLQAFGGLRSGEVCNVTQDKINYSIIGKEFEWFMIDLRTQSNIRSDLKYTGGIKRKRIQPIHPIFLPLLSNIYQQHMKYIKEKDNPYNALFLDRNNEAMTVESYRKKFKRLITLLMKSLSERGEFNTLSELQFLMSGKIGTHVLRHYFSKFIVSLEMHLAPNELAYWRGDSDLRSSLPYMIGNPTLNTQLKKVQEKTLEGLTIRR